MEASQPTLNIDETEELVPVQESCCFCIPRRLGIIVLALIKLMMSLALLVTLFVGMLTFNIFGEMIMFYHIMAWITFALDVVDVVFALFVLISICDKNRKIMKMYYFYSICVFGAITFLCCVIVYISTMNLVALLICLSIFVVVFVMQEYLNQLLKKEALKLERSEEFRI